ncbi:MAG: hypothetical protein O3C21_18740 [Verrucomicrobia bacterium]|nr:hypothetical protein [Verrucomicrobiota bacterium]
MIRNIAFLFSTLLIGCLSTGERAPAREDASRGIRLAIADAAHVNVYEGLPHQRFERELLAAESQREDTEKLGSFRFYTPAVAATNSAKLKPILSSPDTIQVFRGEKACGGFHPDYAVEWFDEDGSRFYAQICFGCHEIIYSDGKNEYRYDFEDGPFEQLKKELKPYAKKRPKTNG